MPQESRNVPLGVAPTGAINELFIFIATDAHGKESVCSYHEPGVGVLYLMAGDRQGLDALRPRAEQMSRGAGVGVKVVRYAAAETVEVLSEPGS